MRYLPLSDADRREMLAEIGVKAIDDLFVDVPATKLMRQLVNLPKAKGELEVEREMHRLASRNTPATSVPFFVGAGAYRHHVPASVDHLIQRSEFLTSYTPYQPEITQGTLQYLFEFQTQVALLTGMDVANASMYDGSTAAGEAVLMAHRITRRKTALLPGNLHPHYAEVIRTLSHHGGAEVVSLAPEPGKAASALELAAKIDATTSCVVVQHPDVFGNIADLRPIADAAHAAGALLIVVVTEIVALGAIRAPGDMGADIVVAEGQSIGNGLNFGGPYVGLFATRDKYVRQMPGRLCGETVDAEGRRGFVLTLSTREQHIRREKATSNICTNSGLCADGALARLHRSAVELPCAVGIGHVLGEEDERIGAIGIAPHRQARQLDALPAVRLERGVEELLRLFARAGGRDFGKVLPHVLGEVRVDLVEALPLALPDEAADLRHLALHQAPIAHLAGSEERRLALALRRLGREHVGQRQGDRALATGRVRNRATPATFVELVLGRGRERAKEGRGKGEPRRIRRLARTAQRDLREDGNAAAGGAGQPVLLPAIEVENGEHVRLVEGEGPVRSLHVLHRPRRPLHHVEELALRLEKRGPAPHPRRTHDREPAHAPGRPARLDMDEVLVGEIIPRRSRLERQRSLGEGAQLGRCDVGRVERRLVAPKRMAHLNEELVDLTEALDASHLDSQLCERRPKRVREHGIGHLDCGGAGSDAARRPKSRDRAEGKRRVQRIRKRDITEPREFSLDAKTNGDQRPVRLRPVLILLVGHNPVRRDANSELPDFSLHFCGFCLLGDCCGLAVVFLPVNRFAGAVFFTAKVTAFGFLGHVLGTGVRCF